MKNYWHLITVFFLSICLSVGLTTISPAQSREISPVKLAQEQYELGNYESSLEILRKAQIQFVQQKQVLQQAQLQALISLAQQKLGSWSSAQESLDLGLALLSTKASSPEKQQILGQLWNAQGHLHQEKGHTRKALSAWDKAKTNYEVIGDRLGVTGITLSQAQGMNELGFYRRACKEVLTVFGESTSCQELTPESLNAILEPITKPQDNDLEAIGSLANSLMLLGKLELAEQAIFVTDSWQRQIQQAPTYANKLSLTRGNIAQAKTNLARDRQNEDLEQQSQQQAESSYLEILDRGADSSTLFTAQVNLLNLYTTTQRWQEALKLAQQIEQDRLYAQELPKNRQNLQAQLLFINSLSKLKEQQQPIQKSWQEIVQLYQDVAHQANQLGIKRLESIAVGSIGQLAHENNLLGINAQGQIEKALLIAQSQQTPEIAYRWQWQLGRIYREKGDIEKSIVAYQAAFDNLQQLRKDIVVLEREIQFSFREQVEPVYRELAELLLVAQAPEKINQPSNLIQARNTIEALQLAELDNYFRDACLASEQRNLEDLDPHAALLYTIILPDEKQDKIRLETILSLADGSFQHQETVIPQVEFEATIEDLSGYMLQPDRDFDSKKLSQKLYGWLIQPIKSDLEGAPNNVDTLVFVLDGVLQNLPMSILYDGDQYLIQEYATAVVPGLRTLKYTTDNNEQIQIRKRQIKALAGGISESRPPLSALKSVPTELRSINKSLEAQTLLNSELTEENFDQFVSSQPFSLVHLATHGQFSSNPEDTFLQLWDEKLTIEEFSLILQKRNLNSEQPIDMLVLSACETARGDRRASLGLAGMSVRTGVSSTVATLWQVSDRSTASLMSRFYRYLSPDSDLGKAEALRRAQLDLLESSVQDWHTPLYWAPYVIVGDWQ